MTILSVPIIASTGWALAHHDFYPAPPGEAWQGPLFLAGLLAMWMGPSLWSAAWNPDTAGKIALAYIAIGVGLSLWLSFNGAHASGVEVSIIFAPFWLIASWIAKRNARANQGLFRAGRVAEKRNRNEKA